MSGNFSLERIIFPGCQGAHERDLKGGKELGRATNGRSRHHLVDSNRTIKERRLPVFDYNPMLCSCFEYCIICSH